MSDEPSRRVTLDITARAGNTVLVVDDERVIALSQDGATLPLDLRLSPAADDPAAVEVELLALEQAFEPKTASERTMLRITPELTDCDLDTRDDTGYVLQLQNVSSHYTLEDLFVEVELSGIAMGENTAPDGSCLITMIPCQQHLRCLPPGETKAVRHTLVTRGAKAGCYDVEVHVRYRVVYYDKWDGSQSYTFKLPVGVPVLDRIRAGTRSLRHQQERKSMDQQTNPGWAEDYDTPRTHQELKPIECTFSVPHGGHIAVHWELRKGSRCTYGCNPENGQPECYFSTQDDATLQLTLINNSSCALKHVRVLDVHLVHQDGTPANQRLPDGNCLIEIVPPEAYYAHLDVHEKSTKEFSVITRGTAPGCYIIKMKIDYTIDCCETPVDLNLTVRCD